MKRMLNGAFSLFAVGALAACSMTPRPAVKAPPTVQAVSNAQQYDDVVASLEAGDVRRARKLLKKMAKRDPADLRVRTLRESIDEDPLVLLGARAFAYQVQRGETMTALSQRFLGDRLKFYLLVRYNSLKDGRVAEGQTIRIPGSEPVAAPVISQPKSDAKEPAGLPPARSAAQAPAIPNANPALAAELRGRALTALNQGKVALAVMTLRRARTADPTNAAVQRDLLRAERLLAAVRARK